MKQEEELQLVQGQLAALLSPGCRCVNSQVVNSLDSRDDEEEEEDDEDAAADGSFMGPAPRATAAPSGSALIHKSSNLHLICESA